MIHHSSLDSKIEPDLPLVSVVIPVYNRARLINRAVTSVFRQRYPRWELIIIDDGSQDGTAAVLQRLAGHPSINVIRLRSNRGANYCRNLGVSTARGSFLNFLDSDDVFHPDKLFRQIAPLQDSGADVAVCQTVRVGGSDDGFLGPIRPTGDLTYDFIAKRVVWHTMAPLWRIEFLRRGGGFDETLSSSQDYEFYSRLVLRKPRVVYIDTVLCYKHEESWAADPEKIRGNPRIDGLRNRIKSRKGVLRALWSSDLTAGTRVRTTAYLLKFITASRVIQTMRAINQAAKGLNS